MEAAGGEKRLERSRQLVLAVRNVEVAQHEDQLQTDKTQERQGSAQERETRV